MDPDQETFLGFPGGLAVKDLLHSAGGFGFGPWLGVKSHKPGSKCQPAAVTTEHMGHN